MAKLAPLAALLLWAFVSLPAGAECLDDPTQAFVDGYDPSGNDFANFPFPRAWRADPAAQSSTAARR